MLRSITQQDVHDSPYEVTKLLETFRFESNEYEYEYTRLNWKVFRVHSNFYSLEKLTRFLLLKEF